MKKEHENFLVEVFQRNHNGIIEGTDALTPIEGNDDWIIPRVYEHLNKLAVDGIYGPKTAAEIEKYLPSTDVLQRVYKRAEVQVGLPRGPVAERGNNKGLHIDALRRTAGLAWTIEKAGPWCAVGISALFAEELGHTNYSSAGAYRLGEKLLESGDFIEVEPEDVAEGEHVIGIWARARFATHQEAHIRICKRLIAGKWECIGANEDPGDKWRLSILVGTQLEARLVKLIRSKHNQSGGA